MTRGTETRQRSKVAAVRYTPDEWSELEAKAEKYGLSPAEYQRAAALDTLALPLPRKRRSRKAGPDQAALIRVRAELARIGNNMNQLAHEANAGRFPAEARIYAALDELAEARERLLSVLAGEDLEP